jgi:hypothetical protein
MKKATLTQDKAKNSPQGGLLVGKKDGQTIIYDDGKVGGWFVGKTHKEGGIQGINKSTGQPIEVQSGEVIITAPALADQTKNEFNGKMMTNREVLSKINVDAGGVAFADGGEVPKKIKRTGASYNYGGQTMTDHEIYKHITGGGSTILAPNGKPSNLNEKQYKLVRTPAFKKWFGDWEKDPDNASKVVDKNGEPLVVYHGTNSDFTKFSLEKVGSNVDYGMWGSGFYFSPLRSFSKNYGSKVLKLFLNIRNPFVRNPNIQGSNSQFKPVYGKEASLNLRNEILSNNYDGVLQFESGNKNPLTQIIAFEPTQIKLADGKNTTFDSSNEDIRYEGGGHLAEGYSLREIASIHQVPLSTLKNQVRLGMKAESEHTSSKREQMKIVKDHLYENPKYYTLLKKAGLEDGGDLISVNVVESKNQKNSFGNNLPLGDKRFDIKSNNKIVGHIVVGSRWYNEKSTKPDYYEVVKSSVKDQNKGIGTKAYIKLIAILDKPLHSDMVRTPQAESVWKKLEKLNLAKKSKDNLAYESYKKGGEIQTESLVKDAKSGNTPARDLNNYNDMLDVEADGQVGGDTGLYADGGFLNTDQFLNYYFEELKDFLNSQNNIDLKEDYSFFYKGESFTIEPIIISDINTSESIKEAIFIIYDIDDEIIGNIEFNANSNKKFIANSEFFEWTNNKFKDGGEIENNLLDNQSFAEFKHSLEYVSKLDLTEKGNKNLAIDVQVEFFRWFVKEDLNSNLKSYYEAIEILPKNKREYCFELFDRDDLFEKLDKNVFYYLPDNLKKEPNIKKIDFAPTPSSENLAKITDLFTDKDMLRPILSGVNFNLEDEEIEVTNAHILLLIKEKPHVSQSGVYVIGKTKEWYLKKAENTKEDSDGLVKLEGKYPLVQRILPNEFDFVFSIDAEKFLRYANASEYFSNEYTNQIVIGFKIDDEHISSYGVNSNMLASCLKAMLMLGYNEIDVCLSESKNRAICLVPKGNSRKVSQRSLTTDLTLLMPLRLDGNESIMDNIYDLENDMPSTMKIMLDKQVEESVLEQENNIIELEPIEVEKNESNQIKEAIEVLELLSETAEGEDKKEIEEAIEIVKMLLETSNYELGGKISNDDFTFRKIETPLN